MDEPGGSQSLISLDSLQFYTSATGSKTTTDISSLGTLRYNLDGGSDSYVLLDAARNHGSGSGDMFAYIPTSNFAGVSSTDFVYMYVKFGATISADGTSEGGFEEWSLVNVSPIPELSALGPIAGLLIAIFATHFLRRRRQRLALRA